MEKKETTEKEKKRVATWDLAREIVLNLYKIVLTSLDFIPLYVLTGARWYKTSLFSNRHALLAVIASTLAWVWGDDKSRSCQQTWHQENVIHESTRPLYGDNSIFIVNFQSSCRININPNSCIRRNPCDKQNLFWTRYTPVKRYLPHSFIVLSFRQKCLK